MDPYEMVLNTIDEEKESIIEFLQKLIRIPSITGNERDIQEFISKKLESIGLDVDVWEPDLNEIRKHPAYNPSLNIEFDDRPNVVGVYKGGKGKSILLNGHVDVIPPDPISAWNHDPWGGEIVGEKLYGRGASDMKSGLAVMTMALDLIIKSGISPKGDVILEYVVDEELSGYGTLSCIQKGYKADAGITLEASDLEIHPASIGRMWFDIIVEGRSSAISRKWEGVSAAEKGMKILEAISEFERIRQSEAKHPLYPDKRGALPCIVGILNAGKFPCSIPTICELKGCISSLPGENPKDVEQQFKEYIRDFAKTDYWLRNHLPKVEFSSNYSEPAEIPADHPICETLKKSFIKVNGRFPTVKGHEGGADSRFLIKYGNTPTVLFGPGTISQMHAIDEWVPIQNVISAVKVIAITILDWCGLG
jgi:acetylornithine deacetylase